MTLKFEPLQFPKDGKPHDNIIEWWYFNGHLSDKNGNDYFFMDCMFKADVTKVNIPFLRMVPVKDLYFHHHLLSDVGTGKNYSHISPYVIVSKDSFLKPLFFINYMRPTLDYYNNEIQELEPFKYRIKTENFDLILESKKKPLLEGGEGFLKLNSRETYYYSLTNMKTTGHVIIDGKAIEVEGKSWMDRQWADAPYMDDKWTWFSIQLDDDTEMICFEYDDLQKKDLIADFVDKDGKATHTRDVIIKPIGDAWTSKKTGGKYNLFWHIRVPSMNIDLTTRPILSDQEMIFGSINYWEGGIIVEGTVDGKQVTGKGFMELLGIPTTKQLISKYELYVQNEVSEALDHVKRTVGDLKNTLKDTLKEELSKI
ncbi:MAG: hypothetical protein KAS16_01605 [Thermoplasmata archaeon]|nr:hypothetical protein [Thermoplasmata archaeon]